MYPAGRGWVAEVERREVEEVDDEHDFSPEEVAVHPEQDEDELQAVGDDVVRAEVRGAGGPGGVAGEEGIEVASLEGEEGDPGIWRVSLGEWLSFWWVGKASLCLVLW